MYFKNWHHLFYMSGHGLFVWSVIVLTLFIIGYNIVAPLRYRKQIIDRIKTNNKKAMFNKDKINYLSSHS